MKKLTLSVLMILGFSFVSSTSWANNGNTNDHPYEVFKNTINDFKTSKVDFYFTNSTQKQIFFESVEAIKSHLSIQKNEFASHKLNKINAIVSIISLVWEAQNLKEQENVEELLSSIPEGI